MHFLSHSRRQPSHQESAGHSADADLKTAIESLGSSWQDVVGILLAKNLALRAEMDGLHTRVGCADANRASLREELDALREMVSTLQGNQASGITQLNSKYDDLARATADLEAGLASTKADIRSTLATTRARIAGVQRAFEEATRALTDLEAAAT